MQKHGTWKMIKKTKSEGHFLRIVVGKMHYLGFASSKNPNEGVIVSDLKTMQWIEENAGKTKKSPVTERAAAAAV